MSEITATDTERTGLSLGQAVAVGINTTSPAYSLAAILAPMAALVGYATPIVLIVSFIPMALTSLAFLYLNRRDPDCGTTFSWVTRAIGPMPGFMAGWAITAAGVLVIGSLAETAMTYGLLLIGQDTLAANRMVIIAGAVVIIMIMVVLAIVGSDSSIHLQSVLTYLQIGILLAFGGFALYTARDLGLPSFTAEWVNPLEYGVQPLVAAMLLGVFAFWGWEAATNLSEECRKPSDAGKAGLLSTVILLVTYVLVAVSVVLYLGQSGFFPVGESGLILVDMSPAVFGPFAFLVLLAVATSALASTQSTMVPGSRAVLSMARRGALPAKLGLVSPRFKTPYVSLLVLAVIAAGWYVFVSSISDTAMLDTLSSLGILIAFYYSLTGIACVVYYRRHVRQSVKGFLMVGVGPILGSAGLVFMLVAAVHSLWDPANSAGGAAWVGLSPPLVIAAAMFGLGVIVLVIRRFTAPAFFTSTPPERADILKPPFVLDAEKPPPHGGIAVDCNDATHVITRMLDERITPELDRATPLYLVFGIEPSDISGEEYAATREALEDDGAKILGEVRRHARTLGMTEVFKMYDASHARQSVEHVAGLMDASVIWSSHRMTALD
ncbi:MAG: APC family permease [Candidatus Nanopelagicales bacterium]